LKLSDTEETKGDIRIISSSLVEPLMYFTPTFPYPLTLLIHPLSFQSEDTSLQQCTSNLLSWILE